MKTFFFQLNLRLMLTIFGISTGVSLGLIACNDQKSSDSSVSNVQEQMSYNESNGEATATPQPSIQPQDASEGYQDKPVNAKDYSPDYMIDKTITPRPNPGFGQTHLCADVNWWRTMCTGMVAHVKEDGSITSEETPNCVCGSSYEAVAARRRAFGLIQSQP